MTERCEVLVVSGSPNGAADDPGNVPGNAPADGPDPAVALAQELRAYRIDVRLAGAGTELVAVTEQSGVITAELTDAVDRVQVAAEFLVTVGERAARDGRRLWIGDARDTENLGWKLPAVLRGAGDLLLDTYLTEREQRPSDYRLSPLSQRFGGKRVRIAPGQRVPDDLVLWSPAEGRDVRLWPARRWTVLGFGSGSAITVRAVSERFGDQVNAQVIGGGNSPSDLVTLLDRYGHVNRRLAKRGGSVLAIRPDRYVGLHTAPDPGIVLAYLEDLIPGGSPETAPTEPGTAAAPESFSP